MNSKASLFTVKIVIFSLVMSMCAVVLGSVFDGCAYRPVEQTAVEYRVRKVIIDAGHGGEDGGAVSVTGTCEKTLNLDLARRVEAILRCSGIEVTMTREDDAMLSHPGGGSKKIQDLRARLALANSSPDSVLVSIHMNKFSSSRYSVLQVYYSANSDKSTSLAELIREANKATLQPDNTRECKPAGSSIFLLHKAKIPAVMVECGFLSNHAEAARLDDPEYRARLACVISSALLRYFEKESAA